MIKTFSVSFFGRVQGVGFRMLVVSEANRFGVRGWVRNAEERDLVEAVFQGEEKKINLLIESLKNNSFAVRVEQVVVNELKDSERFESFEVRY